MFAPAPPGENVPRPQTRREVLTALLAAATTHPRRRGTGGVRAQWRRDRRSPHHRPRMVRVR